MGGAVLRSRGTSVVVEVAGTEVEIRPRPDLSGFISSRGDYDGLKEAILDAIASPPHYAGILDGLGPHNK